MNVTSPLFGLPGGATRSATLALDLYTNNESGRGGYFREEQTDGSAYEGRGDLGNNHRGDGRNFIGRGFIQLTGRSNYEAYERYIGEDITSSRSNAAKVADMRLAFDSAGWFWRRHNLNAVADNLGMKPDAEVVGRISTTINGGCNGRGIRLHFFKRAKRILCRDIDS